MPRPRVAVVGCGLIGRSWAIVFARGGCDVVLYDVKPSQLERALTWIDDTLADMAGENLVKDPAWLRSLIHPANSLAKAVGSAEHVQESVIEELDTKREVLAELDRLSPIDCIIASSTSAHLPSRLFDDLPGRHRCIVAHPMNPPHLAPVVEICAATFTYPEVATRTQSLMQACGQVAVVLNREIDAFILNRLQLAVLNEALRLVAAGYVSPEDLDHTVKNGLALRWSFMGPLETIDLNAPGGTSDYLARYGDILRRVGREMAAQPDWPDELVQRLDEERRRHVPLDRIEGEARWRDRRLMALARHKKEAEQRFGK
jgi:3-hydroxyacyl-CoA dehydrogenase